MRQVLGADALGRWERGSGWGTHVNPWLIHVNVWQKPLQYCKLISLKLIKTNGKKNIFNLTVTEKYIQQLAYWVRHQVNRQEELLTGGR